MYVLRVRQLTFWVNKHSDFHETQNPQALVLDPSKSTNFSKVEEPVEVVQIWYCGYPEFWFQNLSLCIYYAGV